MDYRSAGVDINQGNTLVKRIVSAADRTKRREVLAGIGGFSGLFEVPSGFRAPVLVAGTDGVGTKLTLAQVCQDHRSIGIDLVAMCVNDVLTLGAEPLFFLDYLATGKLDPDALVHVIEGIVAGCELAGCALLGGETAEMPGFYAANQYDLAGFCVGIVEKAEILGPERVQVGSLLLGLPSSGAHSNGYSLIRKVVADRGWEWDQTPAGWDQSLVETFLTPTRIYVPEVLAALRAGLAIQAMAHITGGGLLENLPRVLQVDQSAQIQAQSWTIPPEFLWLARQGSIEPLEMFRTFNMGIGLVLLLPPTSRDHALELFPDAIEIGVVVPGDGEVVGLSRWQLV